MHRKEREEEEEEGGERVCVCGVYARVCVCVCVWKKEAEPVNGELTGFLPLETSAVLLFMWTLSSTATRPRRRRTGAVFEGWGDELRS